MLSVLPLSALIALAPAAMGPNGPSYSARSTIVTAADPSLPIYSAPPGAGYDGVAGLLISKTSGTYLCTGSLVGINRRHVVTAAHCLTGALSVDAVFFPPSGGTMIRTSSSYMIQSGYTGAVIDENDIAVLDLGAGNEATGIQTYDLFGGDAVGLDYQQVGYGASGTGATGATIPSGLRRQGYNRFDFSGADPIFGGFWGNQHILFADFDNGLMAQDASCNLTAMFTVANGAYCDLGLGAFEVLSGAGDSGGPLFVNGRLAAVASFGLTFSGGLVGDIDGIFNQTFGEFAGFVPISRHADWIRQQVVPEPATILLLLTGLIGIGLVRRRKREA